MNATTADRAKVADEVAGQHVDGVATTIALGGTAKVIGADGGLEIQGSCSQSGQLTLVARSTTPHALVRASAVSASESPASVAVFDDADLNPGEDLNLSSPTAGADGTGHLSGRRRACPERRSGLRRADRDADVHRRRNPAADLGKHPRSPCFGSRSPG